MVFVAQCVPLCNATSSLNIVSQLVEVGVRFALTIGVMKNVNSFKFVEGMAQLLIQSIQMLSSTFYKDCVGGNDTRKRTCERA
jgi:hypothetical protein